MVYTHTPEKSPVNNQTMKRTWPNAINVENCCQWKNQKILEKYAEVSKITPYKPHWLVAKKNENENSHWNLLPHYGGKQTEKVCFPCDLKVEGIRG